MSDSTLQFCVFHAVREVSARSRVLVACSGGIDSTVLLHLVSRYLEKSRIVAVHVNHGLHSAADEWERFCQRTALRFGVAFSSMRVAVQVLRGASPEEEARDARYSALQGLLREGDVLMTAHNGDDQAETVLLQLLRGSGPEGLAAMPRRKPFGAGSLMRPLLNVPRSEIELYSRRFVLGYIDDPANDDPGYDRNYIRQRIGPLLGARWPSWRKGLARAASHQSEARALLRRMAEQLCYNCRNEDGTLSVERCLELDDADKKAVLRYWIRQAKLPVPSAGQLQQVVAVLLSGDVRSGALVHWPGAEICHYRGKLYVMAPREPSPGPLPGQDSLRWVRGTDLVLPQTGARLSWRLLCERAPQLVGADSLTVCLRRGGERFRFGHFHKSLKKVFQELGVPPWERGRVPLIYLDGELRLVWWGIGGSSR